MQDGVQQHHAVGHSRQREQRAKGIGGPQQQLTNSAPGAESVTAGDLDGDGDVDVVAASANDGRVSWYENTLFGDLEVSADGEALIFSSPGSGTVTAHSLWDGSELSESGFSSPANIALLQMESVPLNTAQRAQA